MCICIYNAAPQAEDVENKRVLEQLRQNTPDRLGGSSPSAAAPGSRVVSERQWLRLQEELQQSRAKLGRPCDSCQNYELQLVREQETVKSLDSQLTQSRQNVKFQKKTIEELEEKMASMGEQCSQQVCILFCLCVRLPVLNLEFCLLSLVIPWKNSIL